MGKWFLIFEKTFAMKRSVFFILFIFCSVTLLAQEDLRLDELSLPDGFHVEVYAMAENARALAFAEDGTLFAGSRRKGNVYAITPDREVIVIDQGLEMPTGIDYFEGDLYVSEISRIRKYGNIMDNLKPAADYEVINDSLPSESWHGWKFIQVGPDRKLYVPVGAPCNVCKRDEIIFATICRMNLDGSGLEVFAEGVRNTVGFDWEPGTSTLWFTDNGRDMMGDDIPPDELNKALTHGGHYGFPYLHGNSIQDPEFWSQRPTNVMITLPKLEMPAHVAALGMRFYDGEMFPAAYRGQIFIAEHGSWNRSSKVGYRVTMATVEKGAVTGYEVFADGWMKDEVAWGRPADVEIGPDDALYVSDDFAGCVYRIWYDPDK
jgi:glucose/arabinose dehydrogenase